MGRLKALLHHQTRSLLQQVSYDAVYCLGSVDILICHAVIVLKRYKHLPNQCRIH